MWVARARARDEQRGAAALEFALLVPLILTLVFATMAYAYMFSFRQALTQAAAEGARASIGAAVSATPCNAAGPYAASCPSQQAASVGVQRALDTYGMACGTKSLTCAISAPSACQAGATAQCVSVTVSYPYRDHSLLPTVPGMGFTLPETLSFTSTVEVR